MRVDDIAMTMKIMRWRTIIGMATLICCILFVSGCDKVENALDIQKKAQDKIRRLMRLGERDVYKPIREGKVALTPLASGPELMTWRKFKEQRYQWHLETYIRNYEKFGHRSPAWDEKVKRMFADYAVFRREKTSTAFQQNLLDQVNQILESGCKDARIICIKGMVLYERQSAIDAAPYLKQGLELLEQTGYPKRYAFFAASHLRHVYQGSRGAENPYPKYQRIMMKYLGAAALDQDYLDGHQRYYMQDFIAVAFKDNCCMAENISLCMDAILHSKQIDPWISLVTRAFYHIGLGWKYRGNEYAASVTEENMNKFHAEIEMARNFLAEAYELHPEFPEAPAKMIHVSMVFSAEGDLRLWFDRTIAAQFDYLYAYEDMLWALRPRWGGSHEEMLKFGIECLNSGRFDTRVPSKFLVSLYQIGSELDNWRAPYQWPGIYDLIRQYFTGLLDEPGNQDDYDANKSFYAVVAWAAGRYADAHRLMEELGPKFDRQAYSYLNVKEEQVLNDINNHTR